MNAPAPQTEQNKQLHLFVEGHVQGVGFRYFVYEYAQQKNLTGWVRNRYDGQVEVLAEGQSDLLSNLIDHVRLGPSRSMVTDVKIEWAEASGSWQTFSLLPTQ